MSAIDDYCPATDGARSYDDAIAAIREQMVRERKVLPRDGDAIEQQWAREGVRTKREGNR
jgi:hypothetical protein